MGFISTIKMTVRNLLARKGRSFLTMLGIVIGVAGVIIILSLGAGAQSVPDSERDAGSPRRNPRREGGTKI